MVSLVLRALILFVIMVPAITALDDFETCVVNATRVCRQLCTITKKEYVVYDTHYTQEQARGLCEQNGMKLASIQSASEWEAIYNILAGGAFGFGNLWTSGQQRSATDWVWTPNEAPVTFTNWFQVDADGNPNYSGPGTGKCILLNGGRDFKWLDYTCAHGSAALCEKPAS